MVGILVGRIVLDILRSKGLNVGWVDGCLEGELDGYFEGCRDGIGKG
jgi:hypothetical protein